MGFFTDLKEDLSHAVNELDPENKDSIEVQEAAEEAVKTGFVAKIQALMKGVTSNSMVIIGIWVAVILVVCFAVVWALIHFGYKIDEKRHAEIVQDLEKRHAEIGFNKEEIEEEPKEA